MDARVTPSNLEQVSKSKPSLSVVVIGRNESAHLSRCFGSIEDLTDRPEDLELIYVDSGSTDDSCEIAAKCGAHVIELTEPPFTAAKGREAGWRAAAGEWVFFLDGDCVLARDAVRTTKELRNTHEIAIVWGISRELGSPEIPFFQRVLELRYRGHRVGPGPLIGGNYFCRREALETVDGFDVSLSGGENANLGWRLRKHGHVVWHIEEPLVEFNSGISGLREYWRRGLRFGRDEVRHISRGKNFIARLFDVGSAERLKDFVTLVVLSAVGLATCLAWPGHGWAVAGAVGLVAFLLKLWRSRRKGPPGMVLLYAIHTQVHCIPMTVGLMQAVAGALMPDRTPD